MTLPKVSSFWCGVAVLFSFILLELVVAFRLVIEF
jgi:hypothetical protein